MSAESFEPGSQEALHSHRERVEATGRQIAQMSGMLIDKALESGAGQAGSVLKLESSASDRVKLEVPAKDGEKQSLERTGLREGTDANKYTLNRGEGSSVQRAVITANEDTGIMSIGQFGKDAKRGTIGSGSSEGFTLKEARHEAAVQLSRVRGEISKVNPNLVHAAIVEMAPVADVAIAAPVAA